MERPLVVLWALGLELHVCLSGDYVPLYITNSCGEERARLFWVRAGGGGGGGEIRAVNAGMWRQ